jgi:hypothetical protein
LLRAALAFATAVQAAELPKCDTEFVTPCQPVEYLDGPATGSPPGLPVQAADLPNVDSAMWTLVISPKPLAAEQQFALTPQERIDQAFAALQPQTVTWVDGALVIVGQWDGQWPDSPFAAMASAPLPRSK